MIHISCPENRYATNRPFIRSTSNAFKMKVGNVINEFETTHLTEYAYVIPFLVIKRGKNIYALALDHIFMYYDDTWKAANIHTFGFSSSKYPRYGTSFVMILILSISWVDIGSPK